MPTLNGRPKRLVDRTILDDDGVTFRYDSAAVPEFWLEARYTLTELRGIVQQIESRGNSRSAQERS